MRGARFGGLDLAILAVGLAFLYGPMLLLVLYSFNASRLVTVWGGFSTRWYAALLANEPLREASLVSLRVALVSAALATLVGTLAAILLARPGRVAGRRTFTALLLAPMVLPEVIVGLSLLLLFVALGFERGIWTVTLAHATVTTAFVAVVVQARLLGIERDLEAAARDLGASPATAFLTVTLPLAAPAIGAGFLLAFTLSLDDLVVASFTAGPGSTTLPMRIYSSVRLGVTPEINAASSLLMGLVGAAVLVASLASRRRAPTT
ncbi:MAG: ABC transporter permease [Methylobacteriaceae bacterium]|nr:ABC transporter permease [Methylobacteriaceae bacterium]